MGTDTGEWIAILMGVSVEEVRSPIEKEHKKEVMEAGGEVRMFKYPPVERVKGESKRREKIKIN